LSAFDRPGGCAQQHLTTYTTGSLPLPMHSTSGGWEELSFHPRWLCCSARTCAARASRPLKTAASSGCSAVLLSRATIVASSGLPTPRLSPLPSRASKQALMRFILIRIPTGALVYIGSFTPIPLCDRPSQWLKGRIRPAPIGDAGTGKLGVRGKCLKTRKER